MSEDQNIGPVKHIVRPVLPWRTSAELAECGQRVAELDGRVATRPEAEARIRKSGSAVRCTSSA